LKSFALASALFLLVFFGVSTHKAFADTHVSGTIATNTTWTSANSPYVVDSDVDVNSSVTLTIQPGVIVKFTPYVTLYVDDGGTIHAIGTPGNKIYLTSLADDTIGGDTNGDGNKTIPNPTGAYLWYGVNSFGDIGSHIVLDNTIVRYAVRGLYLRDAGDVTITNSVIEKNSTGIWDTGDSIVHISNTQIINNNSGISVLYLDGQPNSVYTVSGLSIYGNSQYGLTNNPAPPSLEMNNHSPIFWLTGVFKPDQALADTYDYTLDFKNTWWGDASGPENDNTNPSGLGDKVSDDVLLDPWLKTDPNVPKISCCSNVLFLPGIEASRLYTQGNILNPEDQLWEPNTPSDVSGLYLNTDGTSVNQNIYTKDVISTSNSFGPIGAVDIYKSLIIQLNTLVSINQIQGWKAYAYDWRQGIDDLITNGTKYNNGQIVTLIDTLQSLANTSKTGNVTIITHSNGGLLAKALIKKLEDMKSAGQSNLVDHIDNLVMVASPQLGTPEALAGLLHGLKQSLPGGLMTEIQARKLGENMPSAYGFLPSKKYFDQTGITPPAVFSPSSSPIYTSAYGGDINSYQEEHNFVLGQEGRVQPSDSDLISPVKGNNLLLTQAESLHDSIDNMTFPASINLINIAGWGKETIASVVYFGSDVQPFYTINGDETVVSVSALYGQGVKYWLDLSNSKLNHGDILENPQLLDFIKNIIEQNQSTSPGITAIEPSQMGNRLRLSVHSPVSIGVYDNQGNFTGKVCDDTTGNCAIKEDIPGSTYSEFGEGKYVNLSQGNIQKAVLQGTDAGTFTFNSDLVTPSGQTTTSSFVDIPVTTQTQAQITVNQTTGVPKLALDVTGDGTTDFTLAPSATFDPVSYLQIMRATVDSLDLTPAKIKALDTRIDNIIKSIQKGKVDKAKLKADRFQASLNKVLSKPDPKHPKPKKLSKTDAQTILDMLNQLLDNLS
jgi:hypothetical protein